MTALYQGNDIYCIWLGGKEVYLTRKEIEDIQTIYFDDFGILQIGKEDYIKELENEIEELRVQVDNLEYEIEELRINS